MAGIAKAVARRRTTNPESTFRRTGRRSSGRPSARKSLHGDRDRAGAERGGAKLFSNMPERLSGLRREAPVGQPLVGDHCAGSARRSFVANSIEEIAEVFPDHELIRSLGCESCLNLADRDRRPDSAGYAELPACGGALHAGAGGRGGSPEAGRRAGHSSGAEDVQERTASFRIPDTARQCSGTDRGSSNSTAVFLSCRPERFRDGGIPLPCSNERYARIPATKRTTSPLPTGGDASIRQDAKPSEVSRSSRRSFLASREPASGARLNSNTVQGEGILGRRKMVKVLYLQSACSHTRTHDGLFAGMARDYKRRRHGSACRLAARCDVGNFRHIEFLQLRGHRDRRTSFAQPVQRRAKALTRSRSAASTTRRSMTLGRSRAT